jgi:curved DNA-binding protein CbpA
MIEDHYTVLGVHRIASEGDILKAYRDLARRYHPDANPDDPEAAKRFLQVQAAFDVLSDPGKRAAYNRTSISFKTLREPPSAQASSVQFYPMPPPRPWTRDPCAADLVLWPAILLFLFGVFSIPIDLFFNGGAYEKINDQLKHAGKNGAGDQVYNQLSVELDCIFARGIASTVLGIAVIVGALNMLTLRVYALAIVGSFAAVIPCVAPCCGLGFFFGTWALLTLCDDMVKDAFWF